MKVFNKKAVSGFVVKIAVLLLTLAAIFMILVIFQKIMEWGL